MNGKKPATLVIAGLGLDYPRQASLEVLEELFRCDLVFSNLAGSESMYFLSLFNPNVRTVSYEGQGNEGEITREILAEAHSGRRIGFVTRGHPLISGHLAQTLLQGARRKNVDVASYGSVSSIDTVLAITQSNLYHSHAGLQIYDSRLITSGKIKLQRGLPALLNLGVREGPGFSSRLKKWMRLLSRTLAAHYPAGHRVFLYGPRYDARQMEAVRLDKLESRLLQAQPSMISSIMLYLPPAGPALKI